MAPPKWEREVFLHVSTEYFWGQWDWWWRKSLEMTSHKLKEEIKFILKGAVIQGAWWVSRVSQPTHLILAIIFFIETRWPLLPSEKLFFGNHPKEGDTDSLIYMKSPIFGFHFLNLKTSAQETKSHHILVIIVNFTDVRAWELWKESPKSEVKISA